MQSFTFKIQNPDGFHARPAGAFVKLVKRFPCKTIVMKNTKRSAADFMFGLMGLNIKCGDTITVITEGEREKDASEALQTFLKANL